MHRNFVLLLMVILLGIATLTGAAFSSADSDPRQHVPDMNGHIWNIVSVTDGIWLCAKNEEGQIRVCKLSRGKLGALKLWFGASNDEDLVGGEIVGNLEQEIACITSWATRPSWTEAMFELIARQIVSKGQSVSADVERLARRSGYDPKSLVLVKEDFPNDKLNAKAMYCISTRVKALSKGQMAIEPVLPSQGITVQIGDGAVSFFQLSEVTQILETITLGGIKSSHRMKQIRKSVFFLGTGIQPVQFLPSMAPTKPAAGAM